MFNTINNIIFTTLGIDTLPQGQQREAMERLSSIVYEAVMLRALDIMNEASIDEFETLAETDPESEALFAFLSEKVPGLDVIAREEAEKLKPESVEIISELAE